MLVLIIGATGRITRLGLKDDIAAAPVYTINRVLTWARLRRLQNLYVKLMECWWCLSYWVALGFSLIGYHWGHMPTFQIIASALTASWIVALVGTHLDPTQIAQPSNNQVKDVQTTQAVL